ncbi:MAG: O-antigen ligase family protein [Vicingus serpentipes]|nr:O-antigen ligase family protein [Vicingus serpentipes]
MVNTLLNKGWYYVLFLIAIFPLLGMKVVSISIILFAVLSFFLIVQEIKRSLTAKNLLWTLLFISFYLSYLIAALLEPMSRASGFILEKKLSLLILPIFFFLTPKKITKEHLRGILLVFALIVLGITFSTNLFILIKGIPPKYFSFADFSFAYRSFFEEITGLHPTYISIYLAFSALIFINYGLKEKEHLLWYGLAFVACVTCLIPLLAKLPILAFLISLSIYFSAQPNVWKKIKYLFLILITGFIISIFTVPVLKSRINEMVSSSFSPPQGFSYNSVNVRSGVWECAIDLIKEKWLTGIGPGQLQETLNNCYKRFNTSAYSSVDYNTHNEYFNVLLSTGVIGLLIFLLILLISLYQSYKKRAPLFFAFIVLISLCFLTENILDRQRGIVFFTFFISLFIKTNILQKTEN